MNASLRISDAVCIYQQLMVPNTIIRRVSQIVSTVAPGFRKACDGSAHLLCGHYRGMRPAFCNTNEGYPCKLHEDSETRRSATFSRFLLKRLEITRLHCAHFAWPAISLKGRGTKRKDRCEKDQNGVCDRVGRQFGTGRHERASGFRGFCVAKHSRRGRFLRSAHFVRGMAFGRQLWALLASDECSR